MIFTTLKIFLVAFSQDYRLSEEQALKIGACFGSGMRKRKVCELVLEHLWF